ncbi:MAG: GDP-mannose 4,6-dehydratase [Deltaproteobacteria bacterium]|nr:GDP-mannose 4,6-dehydratase [Deltaproteobacteria bacterium]
MEPLVELDVRDPAAVAACLSRIRPDGVIHLAGFSEPHRSLGQPLLTTEINVMGTLHVLEAMKAETPSARCVVIGSGDVYGAQERGDPPFTEASALWPRNPYAVTKAAADLLAEGYGREPHRLDVVRVRPFNHTGPGQQRGLVCPDFAYGIARLAVSGVPAGSLEVGNLDSSKDFTDVRDMVRGYVLALERGERGAVYNLASGRTIRVRDILSELSRVAGVEVTPIPNPAFAGAATTEVRASAERFRARTGWTPEIPFERTLAELFEYCRRSLADERPSSP